MGESMDLEKLNEQAIEFYKKSEYDKAREIWEENSKSFHAESMYHLGCMYHEGVGVDVDYKKAYDIFLTCAQNNDITNTWARECLFNVGNAYFNGEGVEANMKTAFEYYTKAADAEHVGSAFNLGYACYFGKEAGEIFEVDYDRSFKYFTIAADAGMDKAQLLLATLYLAGRGCEENKEKAIYYLRLSAKQGNEQAVEILNNIGAPYKEEKEEVNADERNVHFKNVETLNDIIELADMDFINMYNIDIVTNKVEYDESKDDIDFTNLSNEEIERLAEEDNRIALYGVGKSCIANGEAEKGFKMLSRAAAYKFPPAMIELGLCYIEGVGTTQDGMTGMGYIAKAAKLKDERANFMLIEYYKQSGNNARVMEVYHMLADELNNGGAQSSLGAIYQRGLYGEKDNEKARYYLSLAVNNNGESVDYLNLGVFYLMNERHKEGLLEAEKLFTKAHEMGSEYASFYLGNVYKLLGDKDKARVFLEDSLSKGIKEAGMVLNDLDK